MTNVLVNMFANIQNGQMANKQFVFQNRKKICESFLNILWNEGFILGYTIEKENKLKIFLKYKNNKPVIKKIKNLSKSGLRMYYSNSQIWKLETSKFFLILSTNQGLKTIAECKKLNMGGEPFIIVI